MPPLTWSPGALQDISRLQEFLAVKSPEAAIRATTAIRQGVALLADHPQVGRPAADFPPEFREWPIPFGSGAYIVLYRIDKADLIIIAVRHGRENT